MTAAAAPKQIHEREENSKRKLSGNASHGRHKQSQEIQKPQASQIKQKNKRAQGIELGNAEQRRKFSGGDTTTTARIWCNAQHQKEFRAARGSNEERSLHNKWFLRMFHVKQKLYQNCKISLFLLTNTPSTFII